MFLPTVVCGIVIALIRGGSLARLEQTQLSHPILFILGVSIRLFVHLYDGSVSLAFLLVFQAISHVSFICFLLLNLNSGNIGGIGPILISAGIMMNGMVILSNGGKMPVSTQALLLSGQADGMALLVSKASNTHQLLTESTRLPWLADIFALPAWWPLAVAFSIGDVLIAIGAFIFIQHAMGAGRRRTPVLQ